jgi:hypothetical protein
VNPNSEEILELGTKMYPYKDVNLALIEVFNVHSNSLRNIDISIMEYTYNYIQTQLPMIINTTSVNIDTYSEYSPSNPQRAKLIVTDLPLKIISERTFFNIINDTSLNGKVIKVIKFSFGHFKYGAFRKKWNWKCKFLRIFNQ